MPEPTKFSFGPTGSQDPGPFRGEPRDKTFQASTVAIAAVVVVVLVLAWLVVGRHRGGPAGGAAYATNLEITNLVPSQSESLSGGRSTYVDGHIVNHGSQTVTGAIIEASFGNDGGQPQMLNAPVSVIRTRQPYVDTEPLSSAPLAPGAQADFRLIFEGVSDNWNQQTPALKVVQVSTR